MVFIDLARARNLRGSGVHISKLQLVNYRNFSRAEFHFQKGINTIIGENGSGKSNVFRAIRLLLDETLSRSALYLDVKDFNRALGDWRGHWIIVSLQFAEISQDEAIQALFLHQTGELELDPIERATLNLLYRPKASVRRAFSELATGDHFALMALRESITILDYEPTLTGRSIADFSDPQVYRSLVGDFENVEFPAELEPYGLGTRLPNILSIHREVCFTFIQALRDVVSEFHNNRTNPLFALLKAKSGEIDSAEFAPIVAQVDGLNTAIESLAGVTGIRGDIHDTINDTAGDAYAPASLSIKSDLPNEAEKLFQSLKLFVGESDYGHEDAIHELSLGGANLIFLTLKLLQFKYQSKGQSFANFLLIEEPEAHIHTHIQKTLFERLDYPNTQVIYSTHSTQISEVSNIKNVNILGRVDNQCQVFQPAAGLTPEHCDAVQRYLDAVRCSLLFAKSVIMVEGDAEELLIPTLVKMVLGISLDELGISLINIRSTGFENLARLFHTERIRKRCSILTDRDATFFPVAPLPGDSDAEVQAKRDAIASAAGGVEREGRLNAFCAGNPYVELFFAPHTFEVDFIASGNTRLFVKTLPEIYVQAASIARVTAALENADLAISGRAALALANKEGKGWFAILIARQIDMHAYLPEYLVDAILFAHGMPTPAVISKILRHRKRCYLDNDLMDEQWFEPLDSCIRDFLAGAASLAQLKRVAIEKLPDDSFLPIFEKIQ
ncbi:ATP-dependent nuclease [Janthinobacterium lividum]|uniref:ATP-dependent nuclease n=1 Tax=Janthinobacterium lividum TaxID=29581 RepID=UPI000AB0C47F|nr:AAA family ATPase [Janthinobacterium lividum]